MEVNRFSISSYLSNEKVENPTKDGINSAKFSQLVSKSQKALQSRLDNKDLQEVFKNKSVSMLFLDKIANLLGKHHPDSLEAQKFMGGPNSYPSIELIRHLSLIKNNPALSKNTVLNIEKWIAREQACLPISLIIDAWGLSDEDYVTRSTTKGDYANAPLQTKKIEPPPSEVKLFSYAIANEMKGMQPGSIFKMPAGSLGHVTRLEFIKNSDGTFDMIHFNTGAGAAKVDGKTTTASKYLSVPAKALEDPGFWRLVVEAKMQPSMTQLNDLLSRTANFQPPIDIDPWLKKPFQGSGSCSFHAAEAEFKHSLINSFTSLEEGWNAYKQCTSLMASEAVKLETHGLEPSIANMLASKEKVRRRYQDWMTILDNPEKLSSVKNAYINAISSLGVYSEKSNNELIENLPPLMALSLLDKRLNEGLNHVSFEQLNQIRNTYGPDVTFEGFNHMGYNQMKWLESTREVFKDVVEFSGWKGELLLKVKDLSSMIFSTKLNADVQTKISHARLNEESLPPLLTEYLLREDPAVGNQLFQTLITENIIPANFTYNRNVVLTYMNYCIPADPELAMHLMDKIKGISMDDLTNTYETLVYYDHFREALQLVDKSFEGIEKYACHCEIAVILISQGKLEEALKVAQTSGYPMDETIRSIIIELAESKLLQAASKFIPIVPDENALTAVSQLTFELAKRGYEKEALKVANTMPYPNMCSAINYTIENLCQENCIDDALLFILKIPKEFYKHENHMAIEEAYKVLVMTLIRSNDRSKARNLALKIPNGPLQESILKLAKYHKG